MSPDDPTPQDAQAAPVAEQENESQPAECAPTTASSAPAAATPELAAAPPRNEESEASPGDAPPIVEGGATSDPTGESAERPRVQMQRGEDAKAIPSLQGDDSSAPPRDFPNPADEHPPTPTRPPAAVTGIEIPRAAELDPQMEAELAAAMAENPLSAMINAHTEGGTPVQQPVDIESLQPGTRLKGTIQQVSEETIFVDLGMRSPGMIQARQFSAEKPAEVGKQIDVVVDSVDINEGTVLVSLPKARRKPAGNWDAVSQGQIVDAMVSKTNKGGLEITVGGLRGFLPASQVDLGFVENLESYVGQKLTCVITEVNPQKRNLVVSRRQFLQQERQEKEKELWQELSVGQSLTGTVKTIKDYGAFVDLGGVDGFLHVGEISWNRVNHPSDVLKVGDQIQVKVLKLDKDAHKVGLGLKQLQSNPWVSIEQRYPVGMTVSGRVTRTTDFGAFVELEQGVEGLIHISELEHRRVGRVTEIVNEGDQVEAKVLAVEPSRKRISLSLKALKNKPEAAAPPPVEPYERKSKGALRGGRESDTGKRSSGLFGNPDDFKR